MSKICLREKTYSRETGVVDVTSSDGTKGTYDKRGDCFIESDQLLSSAVATGGVVDNARNDSSSWVLTLVVDLHRDAVEDLLPMASSTMYED